MRHEIPGIHRDLTIGCIQQDFTEMDLDSSALDSVLAVDVERLSLLQEEKVFLAKSQVSIYKIQEEQKFMFFVRSSAHLLTIHHQLKFSMIL